MPARRIAMISFHSCPSGRLGARHVGGMNVYVRELARRLGARGHKTDIYTRAHDIRDLPVVNLFQNVRLIHIPAGLAEDMDKAAQLAHMAEFIQNMEDFIQTDGVRYDLIHSHYWLSALAGQYFGGVWGAPQIVTFHTLGALKNRLAIGEREPEVRLRFEQEITQSCRRLVVATEGEREWLIHTGKAEPEKISVVPCGIDLGLFRPIPRLVARRALGIASGEKVILSVGRIEPLKGLERLIKAYSMLQQSQLRLTVIGGDTYSHGEAARLKLLAGELGAGARVEFLGPTQQGCLPLYYSAAELTVVASYYESFCLVILESLACGTPVVSTGVGVAPAVINGTNGALVYEDSPEALAQAMDMVLSGQRDSETIGQIRSAAAPYSWESVADDMAAVYEATMTPEPCVPVAFDVTQRR